MLPAARVLGLVFVALSAVAAGATITWVVVGADLEVQDMDTTTTWMAPPTTARFALGPTTYPPLNLPSTTRAVPALAPAPTAAPMPTVTTPGQPNSTTTGGPSTTAGAQTSATRVGAIPPTTAPTPGQATETLRSTTTTTAQPSTSTTEAPTTTQGTTTTSTPAFAVLGGPCGDIGLIRPVLGGLGDLAICALPGVWQLWAPTTTTGAP